MTEVKSNAPDQTLENSLPQQENDDPPAAGRNCADDSDIAPVNNTLPHVKEIRWENDKILIDMHTAKGARLFSLNQSPVKFPAAKGEDMAKFFTSAKDGSADAGYEPKTELNPSAHSAEINGFTDEITFVSADDIACEDPSVGQTTAGNFIEKAPAENNTVQSGRSVSKKSVTRCYPEPWCPSCRRPEGASNNTVNSQISLLLQAIEDDAKMKGGAGNDTDR